jgi:hypothetical protein
MKRLQRACISIVFVCGIAILAQAAETAKAPLLPEVFAGWKAGAIRQSTDPALADPVNAALLQEYGFTDFASAVYTREDGRTLALKAARFHDASGAYGAFTYYKMPQMLTEKIGDQAASLNERILFYRGNILLDAVFSRLTAMSAAELRELADSLPQVSGPTNNLPGLPRYLPKDGYVKNTAKYVIGPVGLQKISAPLPPELVDFTLGAEAVMGNYDTPSGEAALLVISYPTPQIAADRLRRLEAAQKAATEPGASNSPSPLAPIFSKRTGPLLVVAAGPISSSAAKNLLASVNYDADVTWNENTDFKNNNVGTLVWNALILAGILMLFALVIGFAFGGFRLLMSRLYPERVFDRPENVEFISLHLEDTPGPNRGPGIRG